MAQRRLVWTGSCVGALTLGLLVVTGITAPDGERTEAHASTPPVSGTGPSQTTAFGAFVGSGAEGVRRLAKLADWLGDSTELRVGHTYLPGDMWANIEGRPDFLRPWAQWRTARADRVFVLNVPMLAHNEAHVPDRRSATCCGPARRGASTSTTAPWPGTWWSSACRTPSSCWAGR